LEKLTDGLFAEMDLRLCGPGVVMRDRGWRISELSLAKILNDEILLN
jgi:hypothetical protein